jgi:hypothetical protein
MTDIPLCIEITICAIYWWTSDLNINLALTMHFQKDIIQYISLHGNIFSWEKYSVHSVL